MVSALRTIIAILALIFVVCGCGGKDFHYTDSNETKPGPGLLSGEDGVFTLIKRDEENTKKQQPAEPPVTE